MLLKHASKLFTSWWRQMFWYLNSLVHHVNNNLTNNGDSCYYEPFMGCYSISGHNKSLKCHILPVKLSLFAMNVHSDWRLFRAHARASHRYQATHPCSAPPLSPRLPSDPVNRCRSAANEHPDRSINHSPKARPPARALTRLRGPCSSRLRPDVITGMRHGRGSRADTNRAETRFFYDLVMIKTFKEEEFVDI